VDFASLSSQLPILVVTADGRAQSKAEQVGAYAYLHAPFDVGALVAYIQEGLSGPSTQ
jgi:DNA-binding response OmpR family regulator